MNKIGRIRKVRNITNPHVLRIIHTSLIVLVLAMSSVSEKGDNNGGGAEDEYGYDEPHA